jgi:hypothetical protein
MKKVIRLFVLVFALGLSSPGSVYAQEWGLQVKSFRRIAYGNQWSGGWSGGAVAANYWWPLHGNTYLETGLEFGFTGLATHTLALVGVQQFFPVSQKSWLVAGLQLPQGILLFRPSPLYMGGIGISAGAGYQLSPGFALSLQTGLRYYASPPYREYSPVYRYWDIPIELHVRFGRRIHQQTAR